jgi:HD-like signal output (HDOD) protein
MKGPPNLLGKTVKCVRCGGQVAVTKKNTSPLAPSTSKLGDRGTPPSNMGPPKTPVAEAAHHIGELLLEDGVLTADQVREAIAVRDREGGQILPIILHLGYLDKLSLHEYLSRKPGIASIDLRSYYIPKELISLVPKEIAQECLVLPIDKLGRLLTVGMACPLDTDTVYRLEQITGLTVKPMLCKLDDILETIDRYYPTEFISLPDDVPTQPAQSEAPGVGVEVVVLDEEAGNDSAESVHRKVQASAAPLLSEIRERFARMDALPTFTDTVNHVKARIERGNATVRSLIEIIALDPAIVAKLLSTANAAPYGMKGQVRDANLAAALLGSDGVCEVAMLSVIAANQYDKSPLDYDVFLRRARFSASAAYAIAALAEPGLRFIAQACGLLHGVGSLALACAFPDRVPELTDDVTAFERISDEIRLFGIGHPEAGALLAEEWGISPEITEAIRLQRVLTAAASAGPLTAATGFAVILTDAFMLDEPEPAHAIQEGEILLKVLGITARDALQIFNQVRSGVQGGALPGT